MVRILLPGEDTKFCRTGLMNAHGLFCPIDEEEPKDRKERIVDERDEQPVALSFTDTFNWSGGGLSDKRPTNMVPRTVLLPVQVNGSKFFCSALLKSRAESHLVTGAVVQRLGFPRRQILPKNLAWCKRSTIGKSSFSFSITPV